MCENKNYVRRVVKYIAAILMVCLLTASLFAGRAEALETTDNVGAQTQAADGIYHPSESGFLHEENQQLVDENGNEVQLQGVSTHGLTWFPKVINQNLFNSVNQDMNANLIRLAMYSQVYCKGDKEAEESLELVRKGIEYAIGADLYVIVDWHILNDSNPMDNYTDAMAFFEMISSEYGDCPNILYEIANEPNGDTTWSDIAEYADKIIPVIRRNAPESVILVGTPNYDRILSDSVENPLSYENIFYALHFYAGSHGYELRQVLQKAREDGLPVFVTECGISEENGDGELNWDEAAQWFTYLKENKIGYAVWSLSDKDESSALLGSLGSDGSYRLSLCGQWVTKLFSGEDPENIQVGESALHKFESLLRSKPVYAWSALAVIAVGILLIGLLITSLVSRTQKKKYHTYDELIGGGKKKMPAIAGVLMLISVFCSLVYLAWRGFFSVPYSYGVFPVICNFILLAVELLGFVESLIHFNGMRKLEDYPLPVIAGEKYPDVDIFIATYNEPEDLLTKTVNGCKHMDYPDKSKVHIYLCDDNRRANIRKLAGDLGVNYFDRPDNEGAKAGNLNHAMSLTSSPYVVTFDADMIPRREFLMKTIPYFVDAEERNAKRPADKQIPLGFIQTPQCFYTRDVFQHNLYAENKIPNEQDFFYRTIESFKTANNSVIYGGSNTVLSRAALDSIGGFYTGSITEDFATGMMIESAGFVSLGLPEPLASGMAPSTFKDHIKQRTRWGRGVIVTGKKLKFLSRKGLSVSQKISYWSSVVYWYSPIKNLIYMLSPLLFALFAVPVFRCDWKDLLIFWLPMFIFQNVCLRLFSAGRVSQKRSAVQETSVMPFLLIPILKESVGITMSTFKVTDKNKGAVKREKSFKTGLPFLIFLALNLAGIVRIIVLLAGGASLSLLILIFWLVRNSYCLLMSLFLVSGRDSDGENVVVKDGELLTIANSQRKVISGITTQLTEHGLSLFPDEKDCIKIGDITDIDIESMHYTARLRAVITEVRHSARENVPDVYKAEILDFKGTESEYMQILYDRIPTLPQNLGKDIGIIWDLVYNIGQRLTNANLKI